MQTLKKFEFKEFGNVGARESHPWDKLLDGKIYQLAEGTDYTSKTVTFTTLARAAAKKRHMNLKTGKCEGGIVIQAVPMTPEEIEAYEAKVEETKTKQAEKKEAAKAEKASS